jgi:hypothetical protein
MNDDANPIQKLQADLMSRFPGIASEIDAPADPAGAWYLDVRPGDDRSWIVVGWKPGAGFGVSVPRDDDFWTKPDEVFTDAEAACERVVQLIQSGERTERTER